MHRPTDVKKHKAILGQAGRAGW